MGVEAAEAIKKTLMAFAYTALIAHSMHYPKHYSTEDLSGSGLGTDAGHQASIHDRLGGGHRGVPIVGRLPSLSQVEA
jgi:hypothetical protein